MRTTAQILPIAMPIHADRIRPWNGLDQFHLKRFARVTVMLDRAITVPNFGFDRIPRGDDVAHFLFDLAKIFGGKGFFAIEIVIPAVVDDRADGDLDIRPDFLDRARHNMRQIVTDQFQGLHFIFHRVDGDVGVFGDRPLQVEMCAIHGCTDGFFSKGC